MVRVINISGNLECLINTYVETFVVVRVNVSLNFLSNIPIPITN